MLGYPGVLSAKRSLCHGERVVPIFIDRGAPLRDTLLTPKLAVLPMQAVELHPLTARLIILNVLRRRVKCTVTVAEASARA
jgi:hypothetical protein